MQLKGDNLYCINADQNLFIYKVKLVDNQFESLELSWSACLYLDEIIDAKFLKGNEYAIICTNSETLKLMQLSTGHVEIYPGHSDIIISLDIFSKGTDG